MSDALILDEINEGETILFLLKKWKFKWPSKKNHNYAQFTGIKFVTV